MSSRAISRRQEGTLVILPITAAIAVAVFGAGVYDSAATWRTSVAATVVPGPDDLVDARSRWPRRST